MFVIFVNSVDPFTKKDWYDVKAPSMFTIRQIGKTMVTRTAGTSEYFSLFLIYFPSTCCPSTRWFLARGGKARFRCRTFHEPNLVHRIKYMKSPASESIRNAWFNLEWLSRSVHLARLGISYLDLLWNAFDSDAKLFMYCTEILLRWGIIVVRGYSADRLQLVKKLLRHCTQIG